MPQPSSLYVFGDSLSDAGAFYELSSAVLKVPLPPDSAGYAGLFSDGLIQSTVTAGLLGIPAEVYAVGAARAVGSRTVAEYLAETGFDTPEIMLADPDPEVLATDGYLGGQVGRFLADAAVAPPAEGSAATLFFGANDYNGLPPDATPELVAATIAAVNGSIFGAALQIAQAGVDRILLYNLPDPDLLAAPLPPVFGTIVDSHNTALAGVATLLGTVGVAAEVVDLHRISEEILADPRTFGLNPAHADQPMVLGVGSVPTWDAVAEDWSMPQNLAVAGVAANRLWAIDLLHPSSAVHGVLGSFAARNLADNPVYLGPENDFRFTGALNDFVLADGGDDRIFAQGGRDTVLAGLGDDFVLGGSGDDVVAGGAGGDLVLGGRGRDVVAGSDGNDVQGGGAGRDLMVDGLGRDLLLGGAAADGFLYLEAEALGGSNPDDGGRFFGGCGADTLYLALDEATRAAVEAELRPGAACQRLETIGVVTRSIESYVFVDPADPAGGIETPARLAEADLWGIV
jgi:phospholipase/lecithinase/hemolysin